jgi:hypothetical protein
VKRSRPRRSTVPRSKPPKRRVSGSRAPRTALPGRPIVARPARSPARPQPPRREVARIIDDGDKSLVDVLDSLLNQGVVLNADLVLALANVDLVYVRLSALLCAADRVLPRRDA